MTIVWNLANYVPQKIKHIVTLDTMFPAVPDIEMSKDQFNILNFKVVREEIGKEAVGFHELKIQENKHQKNSHPKRDNST